MILEATATDLVSVVVVVIIVPLNVVVVFLLVVTDYTIFGLMLSFLSQ